MIVIRSMSASPLLRPADFRRAAKLAWKNLQARKGKSAVLALALALSVSGVSGVRGAADAVLGALHQGSRASLGGDFCADTAEPLSDLQLTELEAMRRTGVDFTIVTMILTMVSSTQSPDPVFATVKAVDPQMYPLYGEKMTADLRGDSVIVSQSVLHRLNVREGDSIRIAGQSFRISAVGNAEPEQILGVLDRGLRCILSRESFEKSRVQQGGSSIRTRILLRVPSGFDLDAGKRKLQSLLPEAIVFDYQDVNRNTGLEIESLRIFVGQLALLALALGSAGIAVAVRQHLEQRIGIFAVMKTLGARNSQLSAILIAEAGLIVAAAVPCGIAFSWIAKNILLSLAARYVALYVPNGGNKAVFIDAAGAAILAMIPALASPIWRLSHLRPAAVFRNDSPGKSPGRLRLWTLIALPLGAFIWIAQPVFGSWSGAIEFSAALCIGALLAFLLGKPCLRLLRQAKPSTPTIRLGLGNLTHPDNQAAMLIATISAGAMMMVGTIETGNITTRAVDARLPYNLSSTLLIVGFQERYRDQILSFAEHLAGAEAVELKTQARIRLPAAGGGLFLAVCSTGGLYLDRDLAHRLNVAPGSRVDFSAGDREFDAPVASVGRKAFADQVEIDCSGLESSSLFQEALITARPGKLPELAQTIRDRFPGLAVIEAPEIARVVVERSRNLQLLARVVTWYSVASGLAILMSLVASSRDQRLREMGILSTLGATPKILVGIYTVEFVSLGAIAGIIGSAAACGLTSAMLGLIFHRWELAVRWQTIAATVLILPLLTTAAGWMPILALLRQKPMDTFRNPH